MDSIIVNPTLFSSQLFDEDGNSSYIAILILMVC